MSETEQTDSENSRAHLAESLLTAKNRILEAVARGMGLPEILASVCRLIEEQCTGSHCGILLVNHRRRCVEHGAAPTLPAEYNQAIHGRPISSEGGPCGMAACYKRQVIVADIGADPVWRNSEWGAIALAHGLQACWSTPVLSSNGDVLGTFAIYWLKSRSPNDQDQKLIAEVTHLAAVGMERRQIEEQLARKERALTEAIDTIPGLVWSAEPDGEVDFLNQRWRAYTGLTLEEAKGWGWRSAIYPEDLPSLEAYWRSVFSSGKPGEIEARLRRADGEFQWFLFRVVPFYDDTGKLLKWYGQNTDINELKRAADALRFSEHLARGQLESLQQALVSLAHESEPEKFFEHVLNVIIRQLGAQSVSVWEMNDQAGCLDLTAIYEDKRLRMHLWSDRKATPQLQLEAKKHPVWTEFFQTGNICVYGEILMNPPGARVSVSPHGPWYDWLGSMVANQNAPKIIAKLSTNGIAATICIPMVISGKVTGMFSIRFKQRREFRKEEIELTRAMTNQAMLAMQLIRLSRQSREAAVISERNRMARDIHDTLAQGFTGVIMQLEAAKGAVTHVDLPEVTNRIERAGELARSSLGEARRSVRALRPLSLHDGKLSTVLENLLKQMTEGTNLAADFRAEGDDRVISAEYEDDLLRIAQESLTNAIKHANAKHFKAALSVSKCNVLLQLTDDGCGFDPNAEHEGFGLIGMKERVSRMGGEFIIRSKQNVGTEILITLMVPSPSKSED